MSLGDNPAFAGASGSDGMSIRTWLAGLAMQGLCVPCTPGHHNGNDAGESQMKAEMAVRLADALIKELEK